ncbi:hypothetical protein PGTUg99_016603 [Puccinia graminis f. sp. tritici]|uniref:Uncharacterized protein n=1 Tax=Puccinia graminis f. sp. tritici TaxID=56615 RepID=A0A5B0MYP6_PUCGR|nr:hypothetical protein PGTUg99_016603 [Puccinia graminis f. sp. tritici]
MSSAKKKFDDTDNRVTLAQPIGSALGIHTTNPGVIISRHAICPGAVFSHGRPLQTPPVVEWLVYGIALDDLSRSYHHSDVRLLPARAVDES